MARIPTPIPEHLADRFSGTFTQSRKLALWRLLLITTLVVWLGVALLGGLGFIGLTLLGALVVALWLDDVKKTVLNIWNAEFYEVTL